MGKILSISLDKLDDPIFDSPYGIFTPKKFSSKEKDKKKPKDEKLNKKNKLLGLLLLFSLIESLAFLIVLESLRDFPLYLCDIIFYFLD